MEFSDWVQGQRLQHIVDSYHLQGETPEAFWTELQALLADYPQPLLELALVESLVRGWLRFPMARGLDFLAEVNAQLQHWAIEGQVASFLTSSQFEQITGLDPAPVFGPPRSPEIPFLSHVLR